MLTLGWKASAEQFGPQELLDYGVMAEQHGFDSIVVSDHFHPWKDTDGHAPFSFTWLGAMGARTTRAKLQPGNASEYVRSQILGNRLGHADAARRTCPTCSSPTSPAAFGLTVPSRSSTSLSGE